MSDSLWAEIKRLDKEVQKLKLFDVPLSTLRLITPIDSEWTGTYGAPLASTSWDGDAFSTTAKTVIDLSSVFGVPAGVQAIGVYWAWRDSASSSSDCSINLSPNNTAGSGISLGCFGLPNDKLVFGYAMIPCDANGDIYYQITASGAGTMDIWLQIWEYWL